MGRFLCRYQHGRVPFEIARHPTLTTTCLHFVCPWSHQQPESGHDLYQDKPLEARKVRNLHVVLKMCLFKQRFCTSHGRSLVGTFHNYGGCNKLHGKRDFYERMGYENTRFSNLEWG